MTTDEYVAIGRQIGLFYRRAERLHHCIQLEPGGRPLERAAYGVLGRIAGGGPARLSALATDLCVDLSTASRQVSALEAAGLVIRTPDPTDRRASLIEATETGSEVFARTRDRWLAALQDLLADWTSDERQEFARLFARLNLAMDPSRLTEATEPSTCNEAREPDRLGQATEQSRSNDEPEQHKPTEKT